MKSYITIFSLLFTTVVFSQVGINTKDPKGTFHIDGKGNNEANLANISDDLIFTQEGYLGIGTITPQNKLQIIGNGVAHPVNIKNIQPLSNQSDLLYIDNEGNIGTFKTNEVTGSQIFVLNAKVPTRGAQNSDPNNGYNTSTGINLVNLSERNYMPWSLLPPAGSNTQTVSVISNSLVAQVENINYIKIPKTGFYSIQVQGAFSCRKDVAATPLTYYALDMIMYKGTAATVASSAEVERKRIVVGRNDNTSYAGSFYTVVKLNENDYISFALAAGIKDDGTAIVTTANSAYGCGIGTPSGNASNFSSISLILL